MWHGEAARTWSRGTGLGVGYDGLEERLLDARESSSA